MTQQLTISLMGPCHSYLTGLLASATATLVCAVLSWYVVERPTRELKRYLPGATRPAGASVSAPLMMGEHAGAAALLTEEVLR